VSWVVWQQHRRHAFLAAILLACASVLYVWSGQELWSGYAVRGVAACVDQAMFDAACAVTRDNFLDRFDDLTSLLMPPLVLLPNLLGVFLGAPLLARELEQGTYRLVWTQSISRQRWAGVKLAWIGGALGLIATGVVVLSGWWHGALDAVYGSPFDIFGSAGPVGVLNYLVSFALAACLGLLLRRSVAAMGLSFLLSWLIRIGVAKLTRPLYAPGFSILWDRGLEDYPRSFRGDWVSSTTLVDPSGQPVSDIHLQELTHSAQATGVGVDQFLRDQGYHYLSIYQPADRFWQFQSIESVLLLLLLVSFVGLTFWWLRRVV
jgi:hypothetical protein